jgi:hypothetical protein
MMGTSARGASNAKAKRELGWTLRYTSWRTGFAAAYAGAERGTTQHVPEGVQVTA